MSSDSGLDDHNNQLNDTDLVKDAPNDLDDDIEKEVMDDLFGDNEEIDEATEARARRQLDDEDLDSGDDMDRSDRVQRETNEVEQEMVTEDYNVLDVDHPRHPIPKPSDGETYLLKVPLFVGIEPTAFVLQDFQPPVTDHQSKTTPSAGFSAHKTAQTTIRWRHSPSNPSELQSNARFLRWSDGSLTLQLASDPTVQYEIQPKSLAPQQRNPPKPTPLSIQETKGVAEPWNEKTESWTYLASASNASYMIRVTNKITGSLVVLPSSDNAEDEALERLHISMAASRAREGHIMKMNSVIVEDPELAKRQAEQAEREKQRAARRLEAQQNRDKERASRLGGRNPRSGLTIGGLEDDDMGGRGAARAPRAKPRRKPKNDEYSDDEEEYYGRRRGREDDYDEEDDFIAASDEEEDKDAEGSDDDMDEMLEKREKEQRQAARAGTPKRDRPQDADADADADIDEHDSPVSRQKRRRVVEEDEDEE